MPDEVTRPPTISAFPATSGLLGLILLMFVLELLLGGSTNPAVLVRLGANYAPLVMAGEIWRLLAAAVLHVGPLHLFMNGLALWQLGRFCEVTFGSAVTLALFVFTAITGSLLAVGLVQASGALEAATGLPLEMRPRISAGASGALFGLEGALVAFFLRHRERLTRAGVALLRQLLFWSVGMMVFSFVVPGIDWMAHLGGLAGGLAVGWALPRRTAVTPPLARVAALVSALLLAMALAAVVAG